MKFWPSDAKCLEVRMFGSIDVSEEHTPFIVG
jgi:hypothetical protein